MPAQLESWSGLRDRLSGGGDPWLRLGLALVVVLLVSACGDPVKDPYRAPVLDDLDWDVLVPIVGDLERTGGHIEGRFELSRFQGFRYPAPAGARVRVDLISLDGDADPVLIAYGPRRSAGGWGPPRAIDDDGGRERDARLEAGPLPRGAYLLVVTTRGWPRSGGYRLQVRCLEGCDGADACPLLSDCGGAICHSGFVRDADGCATCECLDECVDSRGCGPVETCLRGECVPNCVCRGPFEPVCGADGLTYANACEAGCAGTAVLASGECRAECPATTCDRECPNGYRRGSDGCETCDCLDPCEACGTRLEPVCSANGVTFANRCQGACQGELMGYAGPCRETCDPEPCELSCPGGFVRDDQGCPTCECLEAPCATAFAPVCGTDGVTYPNQCEAERADAGVRFEGTCPPTCEAADECPDEFECVGGGPLSTAACDPAGADCVAACVLPRQRCETRSDCPPGDVCGREGECLSPCGCSPVYQPVCGADGQTWTNPCRARCAGVEVAAWGECCEPLDASSCPVDCPDGRALDDRGCETCACAEPRVCVCSALSNPVCGRDGQMYDNACELRCAGVREAADASLCPTSDSLDGG